VFGMTRRLLAACGGFLLAVLWFDLMFDVQVLAMPESQPLAERILASIAGYYHRVTIEAFPMNRLVAGVMLVAIAASVVQLARRVVPLRNGLPTLLLCAVPAGFALARVVPNAMRLATRADTIAVQSELARSICRDHILCVAAVAVFIGLQMTSPGRPNRRG
jgi:hypothetical protein